MIIKKSLEFSKDLAFIHSNYNHLLLHYCNNLFHFYIYLFYYNHYDIRVKRSKSCSCLHDKAFELGTRRT